MIFTALTSPISTCEYYEKVRSREVYRKVELFVNDADLPKDWNGIQRLVKVRRWGYRNNIPFEEISLYVLSKPLNSALVVAKAIQGHWNIENRLHWIKDANMHEDDMSIKDPSTAAILAYLNNITINILYTAGLKPVRDTFAKFANKVNELNKLFQKMVET